MFIFAESHWMRAIGLLPGGKAPPERGIMTASLSKSSAFQSDREAPKMFLSASVLSQLSSV